MSEPAAADGAGSAESEPAEDCAVNPAPPPEAGDQLSVLRSDAIGDTMYSERGVLRILMALNQAVPRYLGGSVEEADEGANENERNNREGACDRNTASGNADPAKGESGGTQGGKADSAGMPVSEGNHSVSPAGGAAKSALAISSPALASSNSASCPSDEKPSPVICTYREADAAAGVEAAESDAAVPAGLMELDGELEQQLCQLWDMTAERDVAAYLHSAGFLQVSWPLLGRSPCPRLLEILAGTLANCLAHAGAFPISAQLVAEAAELLIGNSRDDAPLLAETLRLVTAGVCGGAAPPAAPLHAAVASWLPLLRRLLAGALSPHLLWKALELVAAVAAPPDSRQQWLERLAEVDGWTAAMLEALRQLLTSPGEVAAADQLTACREMLRLTADLAQAAPDVQATPPEAALDCVRAVARGCPSDARVAGYLLWLLARCLRGQFSGAALADVLRFCSAAMAGLDTAPLPSRNGADWSARALSIPGESTPCEKDADLRNGGGDTPVTARNTPGAGGAPQPGLPEDEEERLELESQLGATVVHLAQSCEAMPHFVASVEPRVARFYLSVLERHSPELAKTLAQPPDRRDAGSLGL